MFPVRRETMTHDCKRHDTTTLCTPLVMLEGRRIGHRAPPDRHQEFINFLKQMDVETRTDLDLHVIVDNNATHNHLTDEAWLKHHKRARLRFIHSSSSCLNLVERWFREIADNGTRRSVLQRVGRLNEPIRA